jgi:hypothetical protein
MIVRCIDSTLQTTCWWSGANMRSAPNGTTATSFPVSTKDSARRDSWSSCRHLRVRRRRRRTPAVKRAGVTILSVFMQCRSKPRGFPTLCRVTFWKAERSNHDCEVPHRAGADSRSHDCVPARKIVDRERDPRAVLLWCPYKRLNRVGGSRRILPRTLPGPPTLADAHPENLSVGHGQSRRSWRVSNSRLQIAFGIDVQEFPISMPMSQPQGSQIQKRRPVRATFSWRSQSFTHLRKNPLVLHLHFGGVLHANSLIVARDESCWERR